MQQQIPSEFKAELKQALAEWVRSLPPNEANASVIRLVGVSYSPLQILQEVEKETPFGIEYLTGLFTLHRRMAEKKRGSSVISLIMQSVTIPRGQVLLASGHAKPDDKRISVTAKRGDTRYGICSTEFLEEAFRTESYRCDITFNDDGSWTYVIETELLVKGRDRPFNHHDTNTLKLVGAPAPNPLAVILKDRAEKKQD